MRFCNVEIKFRNYIPPFIFNAIYNKPTPENFISEKLLSYSQYHEDLFVDLILKSKTNGFYVDVGANHPTALSNTKRFYDRGWRGINVEPTPCLFKAFQSDRPEDINLNVGVGDKQGVLPFYVMSANTLSSFDKDSATEGGKIHNATMEKIIEVEVFTLEHIFEKYAQSEIDFLSVDTEGYDLRVIQSNNWSKWRPKVVIIETAYQNATLGKYLSDKGYELVLDNTCNSIYVEMLYLEHISN